MSAMEAKVKTTFYQGWNNLVKMTSVWYVEVCLAKEHGVLFVLGDE